MLMLPRIRNWGYNVEYKTSLGMVSLRCSETARQWSLG